MGMSLGRSPLLATLIVSACGVFTGERECRVQEVCGPGVTPGQAAETCEAVLAEPDVHEAELIAACEDVREDCAAGHEEWCPGAHASSDAGGSAGVGGGGAGSSGSGGASSGDDGGLPGADGSRPECARNADCTDATRPECSSDGRCAPCSSAAACAGRGVRSSCDDDAGSETFGECVQCRGHEDCPADMPACTDGECATCSDDEPCDGRSGSAHCDTDEDSSFRGQCVECTAHAQCENPTPECGQDRACGACTSDDACEGRAEAPVCDRSSVESFGGRCVQCTGKNYDCGEDTVTSKPYVCDSLARDCSEEVEGSSGLCGECVSDAECPVGQLCVLQQFESATIGWFCMWQKQAGVGGAPTSCSNARPYVDAVPDAESIDGTTAEVCTLALSTCPAHQDFRATDCNAATTSGDEECGVDETDDGYCRLFESGPDVYRCTAGCGSDDDCPVGFACDTLVTPRVCEF